MAAKDFPAEPTTSPRRGYVYVATAALLWAISGPSAKFLFNHGMTPFQLVQLRLTIGLTLLFVWLLVRHPDLLRIARQDLLYFFLLGTSGMAMVQFTYLATIARIKVAAAVLLQYLAPVFITLYSVLFARESLTRTTLIAVACSTIGCYLVVGAYSFDLLSMNREGLLYGLSAAIVFAWYSIFGEKGMHRYHPWTVLFYAFLFAALFWNGAGLLWDAAPQPLEAFQHSYSAGEWGLILYIAVLGTMVPFGLYFDGISLIRSTRASITATLEPILAAVTSFLFLGEALAPPQLLGGTLVIVAVIILQLRCEYDARTPDLIRQRRNPAAGGS